VELTNGSGVQNRAESVSRYGNLSHESHYSDVKGSFLLVFQGQTEAQMTLFDGSGLRTQHSPPADDMACTYYGAKNVGLFLQFMPLPQAIWSVCACFKSLSRVAYSSTLKKDKQVPSKFLYTCIRTKKSVA
jgi:hypothetical protein